MSCQEAALRSCDGVRLHYRSARPPELRGAALIVHGYSDHSGHYLHLMQDLLEAGYAVCAGDLRGHGQSAGLRGHVDRFAEYLTDVDTFTRPAAALAAGGPLILFGHSMGGLIVTMAAARNPDVYDGLVLAAPYFELIFRIPAWKVAVAEVCARLAPRFALPSGIESELLTDDDYWIDIFDNDPNVFHQATARWFIETRQAQAQIIEAARKVTLPVLLQLPGDDVVVDAKRSLQVLESMPSAHKSVARYPAARHALYHDRGKPQPTADLITWMKNGGRAQR